MKRSPVGPMLVGCLLLLGSGVSWAAEPIRILSLYPITGPIKASSEQWVMGEKLVVEEANASGGILGRKIELTVEDSMLKPDVAASKAQKYLLEGKVDILIGAGSNVVKPLQDLSKQYNVPLIMFAHADDETGKNFTYTSVRPTWNTSMMARGTVTYIVKNLPYKKIYLLNQDYAYGRDYAANMKKELARQMPAAKIVGEDYHPVGSKDLSPFLTKVKMSGAELLITSDYGLDISVLLKQRRELGVTAVVLGPALADASVVRENPEGAFGGHSCDTWFITNNSKESTEFVESWKKTFKSGDHPLPTNLSARDYIGMKVLLEAIKKAGSTETNKLIPAFEGLRVKTIAGEVTMRGCDHQLIIPLQCVDIDKKTAPYFGTPITIPASATLVSEQEVDNARCNRK